MKYIQLAQNIINNNYQININEANELINCPDKDVFALTSAANSIKQHFLGNKVKLCSLVNAKSGKCSENCSFCAQSAHFNTTAPNYPMIEKNRIIEEATRAKGNNASCFSIVTSGKGVNKTEDLETICSSVETMDTNLNLKSCASLGIMSKEQLTQLKKAGLKRFHHNLESSRSFFPNICTSHTYDDRVQTIKDAREVGMEICSGGIFGLGESPAQRVELAFTLRELNVDSIPINILHPIKGTQAQDAPSLTPLEALRLIATYRFIFPAKDVGVLGGREARMGDLQAFVLVCGANVILLGNYLTTSGRALEADLAMIRDLGLEIA